MTCKIMRDDDGRGLVTYDEYGQMETGKKRRRNLMRNAMEKDT